MKRITFEKLVGVKNEGKKLDIVSFCEDGNLINCFLCNSAQEAEEEAQNLNLKNTKKGGDFKHFLVLINAHNFDILKEF